MAWAGLFILFMLFVAGFIVVISLCVGDRKAPGIPRGATGGAGAVHHGSKQYANTYVVASPVYRVPPVAPCWPGVCVGPAAAAQPAPDYGHSHRHQLVQRRRPSSISARITAHGVLR